MCIYICITDSLCCTIETYKTLYITISQNKYINQKGEEKETFTFFTSSTTITIMNTGIS